MTPHKSAGFLEAPLKPSLGEKCQHFQIFCCKIRTQSLEVLPWALGSVAPARPQALQFYLSVCLTRRQILQEFTSLTSPRAGDDATSAKAVYNDQHRTLHVLFRWDLCKWSFPAKLQKNRKLPKSTEATKIYKRDINSERLTGTRKTQQHFAVDQQPSVAKVGETGFICKIREDRPMQKDRVWWTKAKWRLVVLSRRQDCPAPQRFRLAREKRQRSTSRFYYFDLAYVVRVLVNKNIVLRSFK